MLVRPKWARDAHPTTNGWVSSTGELLKKQKISQAQIDEWYAVDAQPAVQTLHEAPVVEEQPVSQATYSFYSSSAAVEEHHHEEHVEEEHHHEEDHHHVEEEE